MVNSVTTRGPNPVAEKEAHIIIPASLCLTVSMWFSFYPIWRSAFWPDICTMILFVQRPFLQMSCGFLRFNLNCSTISRFREKMLSLTILTNRPYPFSLFLIALSCILTFNLLTEACKVWDVALGFFKISDLGLNLQVRLATALNVFHL